MLQNLANIKETKKLIIIKYLIFEWSSTTHNTRTVNFCFSLGASKLLVFLRHLGDYSMVNFHGKLGN